MLMTLLGLKELKDNLPGTEHCFSHRTCPCVIIILYLSLPSPFSLTLFEFHWMMSDRDLLVLPGTS